MTRSLPWLLLLLTAGTILALWPSTLSAATISCDGNVLDCTLCCGSPACTCVDSNQCIGGSFLATANVACCRRTGVKFENSGIVDANIRLTFGYLPCGCGACFGPGSNIAKEITVKAGTVYSKHVDEIFNIDHTEGSVSYEVLNSEDGAKVSVLVAYTGDCAHYEVDQASTCN